VVFHAEGIRNHRVDTFHFHRGQAVKFLTVRNALGNEVSVLARHKNLRRRVLLKIAELLSEYILIVDKGALKGRAYRALGAGPKEQTETGYHKKCPHHEGKKVKKPGCPRHSRVSADVNLQNYAL